MQTLKRVYVLASSIFTGALLAVAVTFFTALLLRAEWAQALSRRLETRVERLWQTEGAARGAEAETRLEPEITLWDLAPRRIADTSRWRRANGTGTNGGRADAR